MYKSYKHFVQKIEKQRRENIQSVLEVQERERRTIALEVHDNLGPLLSITSMQIEALMAGADDKHVRGGMQEVHQQLKRAIYICRDISHELTPFLNEKTGLERMVHEHLQKINTTGKIKVSFNYNIGNIPISQQHAASICRVVLELLTNTIKHAEAKNSNIEMSIKNTQFILLYTDDGKGLQPNSSSGIGMKNIQSRVELLNGILQIGQPYQGIKVTIKIPLKELNNS